MKRPFLNQGFSLIELLISIGIIAVLLVITLGVMAPIKERINKAKCIGNLRQIGVCFNLYLGDHEMFFPPTSDENQILVGGAKGTYPGYTGKPSTRPLNQYVNENYLIFRCPSDVGYKNNPTREKSQPEFIGKTYYEVIGSSYRYNARNMGKGSLTKVKKPANAEMYKLTNVKNPPRFIVMGDSDLFSWSASNPRWNTDWHGVKKIPNEPDRPIANVLFADWHIETIVTSDRPSVANFGNNYHFDIDNNP